MTTFSMAKSPWALVLFFFFFRYHFFMLYQERERALHFHWNFHKDKGDSQNFVWNNSISTKLEKVERTLILNPYINLADGVSF